MIDYMKFSIPITHWSLFAIDLFVLSVLLNNQDDDDERVCETPIRSEI